MFKKIRDTSFIICIFLTLSTIPLGFVDIYYYYFVIVLLFPVLLYKHRTIERGLVFALCYLLIIGVLNVLLENNDLFSFIKVFVSILIAYWYYYLIIKDTDFDLLHLYKLYYKFSKFVAYIGIIQFFSYLVGFKYGYNFSWLGIRVIGISEMGGTRVYPVHSILSEPAAFAVLIAPAVYIEISRLFQSDTEFESGSKWKSLIILVPYILTQSSTAYMILFFAIILVNFKRLNFIRIALAGLLIPSLVLSLYLISPKFQDRLDSSISLVTGKIVLDAITAGSEVNGSALILFNHFIIAKSNAVDHPFGTGLGSHHVAFYRYNGLQTYFTGYGTGSMILNLHDGSSLFTRILSEMGFAGIILTFYFIFKFFLTEGPKHLILINHASLVIIFACLLRGGHYFVFGFPFFIYCYYYSAKFSRENHNSVAFVKLEIS